MFRIARNTCVRYNPRRSWLGTAGSEVMAAMIQGRSAVEDRQLSAARLRQSVREIDVEVARIRDEGRLFQRCGFGSDVHDIQLSALHAERRDLLAELMTLQATRRRATAGSRILSWLLVPPALGALLVQSLWPRRLVRSPQHRPYVAAGSKDDRSPRRNG
jgi:hypothetical protein